MPGRAKRTRRGIARASLSSVSEKLWLLHSGNRQQATGNRQQPWSVPYCFVALRQQATGNRQQATGNNRGLSPIVAYCFEIERYVPCAVPLECCNG
jgi:hypothetical protein